MSSSEKSEISESEIAGHFVFVTMNAARADWPKFEHELKETFEESADRQFPDFEIALAVLAVQMQAVKNLCPPPVAGRIRAKIFECLKSTEMGSLPAEIVEKYQSVWDQSNGTDIHPWDAVSRVLYDRLGLTKSVSAGADEFKSRFNGPYGTNYFSHWPVVEDPISKVYAGRMRLSSSKK